MRASASRHRADQVHLRFELAPRARHPPQDVSAGTRSRHGSYFARGVGRALYGGDGSPVNEFLVTGELTPR